MKTISMKHNKILSTIKIKPSISEAFKNLLIMLIFVFIFWYLSFRVLKMCLPYVFFKKNSERIWKQKFPRYISPDANALIKNTERILLQTMT